MHSDDLNSDFVVGFPNGTTATASSSASSAASSAASSSAGLTPLPRPSAFGGSSPQLTIDGNASTEFSSAYEANPWLTVKFGQDFVVSQVHVFHRRSCCVERFRNAVVTLHGTGGDVQERD
jgi:hypothetical protein